MGVPRTRRTTGRQPLRFRIRETVNNPSLSPEVDITAIVSDNEMIVVLRGEADFTNHEQLRFGLAEVEMTGTGAVHIELSRLGFCDLSAFREIVSFAARPSASGRQVFMHGASPTLKKVAQVLHGADAIRFV